MCSWDEEIHEQNGRLKLVWIFKPNKGLKSVARKRVLLCFRGVAYP